MSGYLDGELDSVERAETERHLDECAECRRELDEIRSVASLVAGLPQLRTPRSVADGVSRGMTARGPGARRVLCWITAAAAVLLVVVNVVYFSGIVGESGGEGDAEPALAKTAPPGKLKSETRSPAETSEDSRYSETGAETLRKDAVDEGDFSRLGEGLKEKHEKETEVLAGRLRRKAHSAPETAPTPPVMEKKHVEKGAERQRSAELLQKFDDAVAGTAQAAEPEEKPGVVMPEKPPAPAGKSKASGPTEMLEGVAAETAPDPEAQAKPDVAEPLRFKIVSKSVPEARKEVMAILGKLGLKLADEDRDSREKEAPSFLSVKLTDEQVAALRKDVEKGGRLIVPLEASKKAYDRNTFEYSGPSMAKDAMRDSTVPRKQASPARLVELHFSELPAVDAAKK